MNHSEIFKKLKTNQNSTPEVQLLYNACLEIPRSCEEALRALSRFQSRTVNANLELPKQYLMMHDAAFSQAATSLRVANDAMMTLYLSVVQTESLMTYSPFILLRSAIESSLYAMWLLSDTESTGLLKRGFATRYQSLTEIQIYLKRRLDAKLISETDLDRKKFIDGELHKLIEFGKKCELVKYNKKRKQYVPISDVPSSTSLFANIHGPSGLTDTSYLFSQLSGITHGLDWASSISTNKKVTALGIEVATDGLLQKVKITTTSKPIEMVIPVQVTLLQMTKMSNLFHDAAENYKY